MSKSCSVHGCERNSRKRGLCDTHYYHLKTYGDPTVYGRRIRGICSVSGCDKPHAAKGYCHSHWYRFTQHGDPLAGTAAPGEPLKFMEAIPLSGSGCITWPFAKNGVGYGQINIGGRKYLVSRIVCEKRNGAPPTARHQAAHSCGNGHLACVSPWHLDWKLPIENAADMDAHGTRLRGEDCPYARLTEIDVRAIRKLGGTVSQSTIGEQFGISQRMVGLIIRHERWAHVI